jgi:hypothetical protein
VHSSNVLGNEVNCQEKEETMLKPLEIPPLTAEELEALEKLYRTTKDVRLRTRAQIVPLAG